MMAQSKKAVKKEKGVNKSLIAIVLLIIAGIVVLSYTNNTGNVVIAKEKVASVKVSPEEVTAGSKIKITVELPNKGVNRQYEIRSIVGNDLKARENLCGAPSMCTGGKVMSDGRVILEKTYRIGINWPAGEYKVQVFDRSRNKWINANFKVEVS